MKLKRSFGDMTFVYRQEKNFLLVLLKQVLIYISQDGPELEAIPLSQPSKCLDYEYVPPCLALEKKNPSNKPTIKMNTSKGCVKQ